jgi:hypothetical protein
LSEFAGQISTQEFWSSVGYWVLVAGLIGDILVLAIPAHRERLEKILAAIFTAVIILGVAIEHKADVKIAVLVSREESASALTIESLKNDIANANAREKEAEARIAEATQQLEAEHLARLKLEARVEDRRLTAVQKRRIDGVLSAHPGYAVTVVSRFTDSESKAYGDDFVAAFKAAKWNALSVYDWLRDTDGVSIATVSGAKGAEVKLLDAALTAARIPHRFTAISEGDLHTIGGSGFQSGMTYLLIGHHKP